MKLKTLYIKGQGKSIEPEGDLLNVLMGSKMQEIGIERFKKALEEKDLNLNTLTEEDREKLDIPSFYNFSKEEKEEIKKQVIKENTRHTHILVKLNKFVNLDNLIRSNMSLLTADFNNTLIVKKEAFQAICKADKVEFSNTFDIYIDSNIKFVTILAIDKNTLDEALKLEAITPIRYNELLQLLQ